MLSNLDQVLRNATGLPVSIAENPLACVVKGTGSALDNLPKFKNVLSTCIEGWVRKLLTKLRKVSGAFCFAEAAGRMNAGFRRNTAEDENLSEE